MKNNKLIIILFFAVLTAFAFWMFSSWSKLPQPGQYDEFAKCLAVKGITMYGADWCSHCQNEKNAFGSAFEFVSYVECPKNIQQCLAKGIQGYPTWIFPDGRRFEGEQGLKKLSQESGCQLTINY